MARKALVETNQAEEKVDVRGLQNRLKKLIPIYGGNKIQLDDLKKVIDGDNKEIKAICKQLSIEDMSIDGWKMKYSVAKKHQVDEDKMLEIIKKWWTKKHPAEVCPYVKIEEHIDNEAVKDAIYRGEFDKKTLLALQACDTEKLEEKLSIQKEKTK